jgi:hypothetical protein
MNNRLGDDDAVGLGKGLEYNRSVRILHLVSVALFDAFLCLVDDRLVAGGKSNWRHGCAWAGGWTGIKRNFD